MVSAVAVVIIDVPTGAVVDEFMDANLNVFEGVITTAFIFTMPTPSDRFSC